MNGEQEFGHIEILRLPIVLYCRSILVQDRKCCLSAATAACAAQTHMEVEAKHKTSPCQLQCNLLSSHIAK